MDHLQWMRGELDRLAAAGQARALTESAPARREGWIIRNGRSMLNLASNHYLGLHHEVNEETLSRWNDYADRIRAESGSGAEMAATAGAVGSEAGKFGEPGGSPIRTGATASRLIVGGDPILGSFEREFAAYKGTEACLLFGSGFMANVGIISALAGRNDLIFSDKYNHASIVDGAILSRAKVFRYRNRDMNHLEQLLRKADPAKHKLVVTDSVFSMDGSIAPLRELVELKERYGAMLMVDEAHSGGVFGLRGEGLAGELGLAQRVDVHMGTFSKAYGCYGAYAAGPALMIDYLINKARSLIYSTALPPMLVYAIRDQWNIIRTEGWRRDALLRKAAWLRGELRSAGFDTGDSECHIVPVIVGDNERSLVFGSKLQEAGIAAVPIRPPTVPEGSARIRLTPMATHRDDDLRMALDTIVSIGLELGVI
ncbi:aminotransferase class I/II-fold pyridoxal phosphate-dependent enzyme [Paenibacillus sp. GCM10012303]|uniref:aminotransferase class I/II-fold pyridoxal phosphate-dependent enzyme n=1 Tax=Paenibacillus sp. GCM10012303 TaxID=3317340 RepID=UPI003617FC24